MEKQNERTITLMGEQLTVKFNMAVEILFEKMSGVSFTVKALESATNTLFLYAAIIIVNNPDSSIDAKRLMTEATFEDIKALREATIDVMMDWCLTPDQRAEYYEAKKELKARQEESETV